MNKQQKLQHIWATTDKPVIEMMKKTSQSPSAHIVNDATDENSDPESLDSSCGSFVAVPKEFRPPFSAHTKIKCSKSHQTQNKQNLSEQNFTSSSNNISQKAMPIMPLLETPKPPLIECKKVFKQNKMPVLNKNTNHSQNLQKMHQIANHTMTAQNKAGVKNNADANRKTLFQPPKKIINNSFQKHGATLSTEDPKNINRYKYVEHRTVIHNFEMPSKPNLFSNDGLKIDPIETKNLKQCKKVNKIFIDGVEQHSCKDAHKVTNQESMIKWDSSLNLRKETDKFKEDYGRDGNGLSYQENIVKWDSSLNLNKQNSNNESGTEQKFCADTLGVSYRKHIIKWHSSLNLEDHITDSEGNIEWTIIREKKTTVSAKKIQGKNHIHKQINNECPGTKPVTRTKYTKRHHKNFNNNFKQPNINHGKNTPRPDDRDKVHHKSNFQLNKNLKCDNTEIRNCKTQKECSVDAETFTQHRPSEKILHNQINQSLSNEKEEFMVNSNTNTTKDIGSLESNFYPEKIENPALKYTDDEKKSMLYYGREMADLIIGSHAALSLFMSMFNEWKHLRLELISHFNYLEKNLKEASKKFTKYKDLLSIVKTGAQLAAAVPIPHLSIAAKIINVITGLFSGFLTKTETMKAEVEDSNEITLAASKDTNASSDVYTYGLQCGLQFEETAKLIEEFHSNVGNPVIFESDSPEIATFMHEFLEYKPRHRIFYKKLHKCFQELLHNSKSEFSKRFCEPFLLYSPEAIDVIELLDWRFRHEDFNGESVRFELKEIERLIQGDTTIKELMTRVQNCVRFLEDELKFLEGCVKDISLFDSLGQHGIKAF